MPDDRRTALQTALLSKRASVLLLPENCVVIVCAVAGEMGPQLPPGARSRCVFAGAG